MLMLLCTTAWAAEETIGLTAEAQGYENGDLVTTVEGDVVTLTFDKAQSSTAPAYYSTGDAVRLYKGGTLTISAAGNTITQVVFVYELNGNATVSVSPGSYDADSKTWTGSALEVVLTAATEKHVRISQVTVTYEISETPVPASPTILLNGVAPATSYYVSDLPLSLTITSNNGTETPYYHYSFAADPETVSSTIRAGATELTTGESSALNLQKGSNKLWVAEAIPNTETQQWTSSQWASATFTIKEDPTTVANIAALTALADGTEFRMTGTATVVYVNDKYMYIKDETGSTLLYQSKSAAEKGYTISNIVGEVSVYNNLFEVKNAEFEYQPNTIEVEPVVMTIPNIASTNMNQYVKVEGLTLTGTPTTSNRNFTMSDGANSLAGYWRFNDVVYPTDLTKIWDVTGFVAVNGQTVQLFPTDFTDATPAAAVETPVITFDKENPVEGETVNCTITCATEGATIMYALGEGEYQNYTAAIPLTETTTVKAKATKGGAESNVATATITFAAAPVEYGNFQLVTSENDLEIDKNYVIVTTAHDFAMGALTTGSNPKGSSATGFTLNNNIVTLDNNTDVMVLKLGKTNAGDLTLAMPDGKYINLTATSGTNITASESATTLTIAIDEDAVATIQGNTSRQILYQYGSANVFGNYASSNASNTTSYCTISLYKETEEVVPQPTYTITLDKQPGEYATLINVKATVEPALPEGATLKYTIDDADPVAYDSEKGVSLLKSSVLKFTAYDAQNNALTDPVGGQYKYIVNVFGDMDGDGEVTVTDLNIVLNLILGKI